MNTLKEFDAFLTKAQNVAFEQRRDQLESIYPSYTKAGDASEADYRSVDAARLTQWGYTPLGGTNHRDTYKQGTERVTPFKKLTLSVITPEEIRKDMMNNSRVQKDKIKLFRNIGPDLLDTADWTREVICTDFFTRATSTTATQFWPGTFRDGLAFASTSHTLLKSGSTWSNLQTAAAMSQLAILEGLQMLANIPTEEGRPQGAIGTVLLLHGRFNQFRVMEILQTQTTPDTANLTINPLAKKLEGFGKIQPVLVPYLPATYSGWALVDAKNNKAYHFEKEKPTISSDVDINNGNMVTRGVMRFAIDADSSKEWVINAGV